MKLQSNPFILNYRVTLWGKRGFVKTFRTAVSYNLVTPTGRVLWKRAQKFPPVITTAAQKREFLSQVIHHIEQQRERKNLKSRLKRREEQLKKLASKLKREEVTDKKLKLADEYLQIAEEKERIAKTLLKRGVEFVTEKKKLFSQRASRDIEVVIKRAHFDPIPFKASTMRDILEKRLAPVMKEAFVDIWRSIPKDQQIFLIRLLYRDRIYNKKKKRWEWKVQGFGLMREEATTQPNVEDMVDRLMERAYNRFVTAEKSYFASGFVSDRTELVGFTIEHTVNQGPRLQSKALEKRVKEWLKERAKFDAKKEITKAELARERRRRGFKS